MPAPESRTVKAVKTGRVTWASVKGPGEVLDYCLDFSTRLQPAEHINRVEWEVPPGITKDSQEFGPTTATIWLSGGAAGKTYFFLARIDTAGGRTIEQRVSLQVKER